MDGYLKKKFLGGGGQEYNFGQDIIQKESSSKFFDTISNHKYLMKSVLCFEKNSNHVQASRLNIKFSVTFGFRIIIHQK